MPGPRTSNITLGNTKIEQIQTFCYLGFEMKASGVVSAAVNTLYDKANKAMRPLMGVISRFDIPVKTALTLFHTYISPIALYAVENWAILSEKKILRFGEETIFIDVVNNKPDILHRQFLKFLLGTSRSCPNMAVYGEMGEIPLSLKAYRLLLKYWYRVTFMPDDTFVKKALLENIRLRTKWIRTIEKIIGQLNLSQFPETINKFGKTLSENLKQKFLNYWAKAITESDSRLSFYGQIKQEFKMEPYLNLSDFRLRKTIAKFRCSDHTLEIEKGRHKKIPRDQRICKVCLSNNIETETHFLINCEFFEHSRNSTGLVKSRDCQTILQDTDPEVLGKYLMEAFLARRDYLEGRIADDTEWVV